MTAPELVELIADALAKHAVPAWGADGKTGTCFCSEPINAERPTIHARTRALSAHQARAVLAALTEAGTVEWGVLERPTMAVTLEMTQRIVHPVSKGNAFDAVRTKGSVYTGVVSRLVLPWTAVQ